MTRPQPPVANQIARHALAGVAAVLLLVTAVGLLIPMSSAENSRVIPAPEQDRAGTADSGLEVAVLAGGCFWGVQGIFQHVKGVTSAVAGYAGGEQNTAKYSVVTTGRTGHAEAVRVTYDPHEISYGGILQIFFSVAHDPTQLNRQGPDFGTQYRSAVFPVSPEQGRIAAAYIAQLEKARAYPAAIVTKIEPNKEFYPAEEYHQDFMTRNPMHPYIVRHDLPKIEHLKRIFADVYRVDPVLVAGTRYSN